MSFEVEAQIRSTISFSRIRVEMEGRRQAALHYAEVQGRNYLLNNTPVDEGVLVSTAYSHQNQSAVWFGIAGTIDGRPYGFAQEHGWHDRSGWFNEGHHMVENAQAVAYEAFVDTFGAGIGYASASLTHSDDMGLGAYGTTGMTAVFRR